MSLERHLVRLLNRRVRPRQSAAPDGGALILGVSAAESHQQVWLDHNRRKEHLVMVGKTGMGKTHSLEALANQHFRSPFGFVFFDFHGDATEHLLSRAAAAGVLDRVALIDPTDAEYSPALNPLESRTPEQTDLFARSAELSGILRRRWGVDSFGARTEELLRNVMTVLIASRQTLIEAPLLLTSANFRGQLLADVPDNLREYWTDRFEPLTESMKAVFREPLLNKITEFLSEPSCRHLLGQRVSSIRFADAMRQGQFVFINLAKGRLREHSHTLANLIFAHLQFEIFGRVDVPEKDRRLFTIICDEVQNLAENDLVTLLTEGRKFGVSLVTANQFWDQLPKDLRGALLSAGSHLFFRLSAADAGLLAPELSVTRRQRFLVTLTTLPIGEAIARLNNAPPVHVRIPALPTVPPLDRSVRRALIEAFATRREQVETEISRRRSGNTSPQSAQSGGSEMSVTESDTPEGQHEW